MAILKYYNRFSVILAIYGFCTFSLNRSGTRAFPCLWKKFYSWCYLISTSTIAFYIAFDHHKNSLKSVRDIIAFLQTIANTVVFCVSLLVTIAMRNHQIKLLNKLYMFDQKLYNKFGIKINDSKFFYKLLIKTVLAIFLLIWIKLFFAISSGQITAEIFTLFYTWLQITLLLVTINVSTFSEILTYRFRALLQQMTYKSKQKTMCKRTNTHHQIVVWCATLLQLCQLKNYFSKYYGPELLLNIVFDANVITTQFFYVILTMDHGQLRLTHVMFLLSRVLPISLKNLKLVLNLDRLAKQV